ncbi:MAG: hypothetical protein M3Z04_19615 [Chloroflexota bacterium]|nr:hypothetical protein [Chloroflexota bacterium]
MVVNLALYPTIDAILAQTGASDSEVATDLLYLAQDVPLTANLREAEFAVQYRQQLYGVYEMWLEAAHHSPLIAAQIPVLLDIVAAGRISFSEAFTGQPDGGGLFPPSHVGILSQIDSLEASLGQPDNDALPLEIVALQHQYTDFMAYWIELQMDDHGLDPEDPDMLDNFISQELPTLLRASALRFYGAAANP